MKRLALFLIASGLVLMVIGVFNYSNDEQMAKAEQERAVIDYYESKDNHTQSKTKAILKIPAFGKNYIMPIVNNVNQKSLDAGMVGVHGGVLGKKGNYSLAAHRVTNGEPFRNLPSLREGDEIIVEKDDFSYIYEVLDRPYEVHMNETWVLDPEPGGLQGRLITLVTCASLFHTEDRLVVHGELREINETKRVD